MTIIDIVQRVYSGGFLNPLVRKEPLDITTLLQKCNLESKNPNKYYYQFKYPARLSDYRGGKDLALMYRLLQKHNGQKAASAVCQLIYEIDDLAVSQFVIALGVLFEQGWNYSPLILNELQSDRNLAKLLGTSYPVISFDPQTKRTTGVYDCPGNPCEHEDETELIREAFTQMLQS